MICHGPWLLINAGVAKGRTLTSYHSLSLDLENAGATWKDEEVVVDGKLITSRNPDDLPAFVEAISEALGLTAATGETVTWGAILPQVQVSPSTGNSSDDRQRLRRVVRGQLLVLDVEEDPHDHRGGPHHEGAHDEGVRRAVGERCLTHEVVQRLGDLAGRG